MSKGELVYKLTDEHGKTYRDTQWGPGASHRTSGTGQLCSPGWLHFYRSPLTASFMNPVHAAFEKPRLWEASAGKRQLHDGSLKSGSTYLRTIRKIPLPELSLNVRVRVAIQAAKLSGKRLPKGWCSWAEAWLSGNDRTSSAASNAISCAASRAANAASCAASCAANAASYAANTVNAASYAANAVNAASRAASRAAEAGASFDLAALIEQAIKDEAALEAGKENTQ